MIFTPLIIEEEENTYVVFGFWRDGTCQFAMLLLGGLGR